MTLDMIDSNPPLSPIPQGLIKEIDDFRELCNQRYRFNSRWDNVLNVVGIAVSIGIIACGIYKWNDYAALLGGVMTAIISAQRAFPFNQRWQFYRTLDSQAENLLTEARNSVLTLEQAITTMKAMRLDFAQQIPRGSSFRSDGGDNDRVGTAAPPDKP